MEEVDDREVILKEILRRLPKCPALELVYSNVELEMLGINVPIPMLIGHFSTIMISEEGTISIRLYNINADVCLFSPDPIGETVKLIKDKLCS